MKEPWHLPRELPVKGRDRQANREVTLILRGQVGDRMNSNVGLQGPGGVGSPKLGSTSGNLAPLTKASAEAPRRRGRVAG